MRVKCIKAFGDAKPGDEAEVPDGAKVDPVHWEAVPPADVRPADVPVTGTSVPPAETASLPPVTPLKEGM